MDLPASFADYTRALLGADDYSKLTAALNGEPPVSIRLNEDKLQRSSFSLSCASALASLRRVPWSDSGFYLCGRPAFTFDPLLHAGCYYVQEASSMFTEQALRQHAVAGPLVMLDLCAAPGGKSILARSVLPEGSLLVSNEVIRTRAQVLTENLTKWGHPGVVVTRNDPADFAPLLDVFDVILADVPCSGEGMFRKDAVALTEWSPQSVELCSRRQRRILTDVWPCLKPGGILIYSTCTYNTHENEENIRWLRDEFGAEVLSLHTPPVWNITGNLLSGEDFPVYRFLPYATEGEGFFLAALRKPTSGGTASLPLCENRRKCQTRESTTAGRPARQQLAAVRDWLLTPDAYEFIQEGALLRAFPKDNFPLLSVLRSSLHIMQAGVEVAEQKGRDWLPTHALALSTALSPDAFTRCDVDYPQAIAYLRRESLTLPATVPLGTALLTYRGIPLGFVKHIGSRANNLYPQEWRIRNPHLPQGASGLVEEALQSLSDT